MIDVPPEASPAIVQADPDSLYRAGVADRAAGRFEQAAGRLRQVLAARPGDVDARLNLGLALLALGRSDEARRELEQVVAEAPDYADAWVALARIAQRAGDRPAARAHLEQAAALAPDSPDVAALRRAVEEPPSWRLELSTARSRLTGGLEDWTESSLSFGRALSPEWSAGLVVEASRRFGAEDVHVQARADRRFARGSGYFAVGGTPDADYRPELAVAAGGEARLSQNLFVTVDATVARYPTGTVSGLHPGVALQTPDARVRLSARWINVRDEAGVHRTGFAAAGRWQASERLALRIGYADAPESSEGRTVDVIGRSLGADIGLTDRLLLRLGYTSEDRTAYDREELSLGLGWRF